MVPLKYLRNFWRTLEMPLINCEIKFFLSWSKKMNIVIRNYGNAEPKFIITDTKFYVPVVNLSAQDYEKLLQQLKASFNWNKSTKTNITEMIPIFKLLN